MSKLITCLAQLQLPLPLLHLPPFFLSDGTFNPSGNLIVINTASHLPLKLNQYNFMTWRAQLDTVLVGYDLPSFVTGATK